MNDVFMIEFVVWERCIYFLYFVLNCEIILLFFFIWNKIYVLIKENLVINYWFFFLILRGFVLEINEMKSLIVESINLYCK